VRPSRSVAGRDSESERIRRVYARYDADPQHLRKRDAHNRGNRAIRRERRTGFGTIVCHQFGRQLSGLDALDIGCGAGVALRHLAQLGFDERRLAGVDLLEERIQNARMDLPSADLRVADASQLPFQHASFDLVTAWTVFSSILDDQLARAVATEMARVLKPDGAIGWYDVRVNNPFNPNTRPYTKGDIANLFPGFELHLRSITLAPPIARRLGPLTPVLYPALAAVPPLRTHYLGLLTRRA
jgi:ubiquinone/menaquinone biosynthesis C-methylase UbiE